MIRDEHGSLIGLSHELMKSLCCDASCSPPAGSHTATCPSRANGFTSAQKEETSTSSTWSPSLSQATSSCGTKPSNCECLFHNCPSVSAHRPFPYDLCDTRKRRNTQECGFCCASCECWAFCGDLWRCLQPDLTGRNSCDRKCPLDNPGDSSRLTHSLHVNTHC